MTQEEGGDGGFYWRVVVFRDGQVGEVDGDGISYTLAAAGEDTWRF